MERNVPVLLVGLGGIGGSIVDKVMGRLPEANKEFVGAVAIDTDLGDLNKLENVSTIWMGNDGIVKSMLNRYPEYLEWFPANKFINTRGCSEGAGQIRSIARLVMAASVRSDHNPLEQLDNEIRRILTHDGEKSISRFNVFIAGSITGGTGAGSFLQIPYYIKDFMERNMPTKKIQIRGMFVSPDITEEVNPSVINREAVKINAYACMKELNALYMAQASEETDREQLELEFYTKKDWIEEFELSAEKLLRYSDKQPGKNVTGRDFRREIIDLIGEGGNIPYDSFYLVEGIDNLGAVGNNGLETVKDQVAGIIYTLLFTPVSESAASAGNNETLLDIECNGMNRYSAAGLCTLRYPYKQIKEYVSLRFSKQLINDEWLLLDAECDMEVKDAMTKQKSDPTVKIPDIADMYTRYFEKETSGDEGTRLGALRDEAFDVIEDSIEEPVCKLDDYLSLIEGKVDDLLNADKVRMAEKNCDISHPNLKEYSTAISEVTKKTDAVEQFAKIMIKHVTDHQFEVANEVFPEAYDSMVMHKNSPLNVYSFLGHTHPVAARYLCYKMVIELDNKLMELGTGMGRSALDNFNRIDYDPNKDSRQTAQDVIRKAENKKLFFVIPAGKSTLADVTDQFQSNLSNQIQLIKKYGREQLEITTYRILRRRFAQLAENYGAFFDNVKNRIDGNNERIENLEKSYIHKAYGTRIIYGSPDAFKKSYSDFTRRAVFKLPEEAKEAVFLGLYRQACVIFDNEVNVEISSEIRKRTRKRVNEDIAALFDTAVMKNMRDYVDLEGDKVVNISIKEAIVNDLKLEGYSQNSPDFENRRIKREKELIELAMKEAAPMVSVTDSENTSENVYIAMNPESGEQQGGDFSLAATQQRIANETTQATDFMRPSILVDNGFSKYEIICLKVKHKYKVEQLAKYRAGSEYAQLYHKRISNIGREPLFIGDDAFKTVVTPHLNKYWHEDGFLPALTEVERVLSKRKILKAFIYSMGMDIFILEKEESLDKKKKWKYINIKDNRSLVKEKGKVIRNGYVDLFKSLRNNRNLVDNILERAKYAHEIERSGLGSVEEGDAVNELVLLRDLIQETAEYGDSNIIDIFEVMLRKEHMDESSWNELFTGLQMTLTEYLKDLYGENYIRANEIYKNAIVRMFSASSIGKKEAEAKQIGEKAVFDDYEKKVIHHIKKLKETSISY